MRPERRSRCLPNGSESCKGIALVPGDQLCNFSPHSWQHLAQARLKASNHASFECEALAFFFFPLHFPPGRNINNLPCLEAGWHMVPDSTAEKNKLTTAQAARKQLCTLKLVFGIISLSHRSCHYYLPKWRSKRNQEDNSMHSHQLTWKLTGGHFRKKIVQTRNPRTSHVKRVP